MSKYIPGPWEMLPPTGQTMTYIVIRSLNTERYRKKIAVVESTSPSIATANARAIQAVPDLIEALEDTLKLLPHFSLVGMPGEIQSQYFTTRQSIHDALANAKGEAT